MTGPRPPGLMTSRKLADWTAIDFLSPRFLCWLNWTTTFSPSENVPA